MSPAPGGGGDNAQKVEKAFTKGEKMFKQLTKASTPIEALTQLVMTIIDATGVLKPLQAVLDVILGLFGVMGAEIIPVLMEAVRPLIDILMQMKPLFQEIGQIIGYFIGMLISAVMPIIIKLFDVVKPFFPLLSELTPLFELLFMLMFPFLPLLELLIPLIELLEPLIWGLVYAVRAATPYIRMATGAIKDFAGWIKDLAELAEDLNGGGGGGGGGGGDEDWWPYWQEGTHFVPRTGPAIVHKGEEIKPSHYVGVQEELLGELKAEFRKMREEQYFQNAFVRRRG